MPEIKTPLELYKLLDKSNCRQCRLPSCMAFAVAVMQGEKIPADCPTLDARSLAIAGRADASQDRMGDQILIDLQKKAAALDFAAVAGKLGLVEDRGRLAIPCLGKLFFIAPDGTLASECHNNPWVHLPLLHYILHGKGKKLCGEWVAFGELPGAEDWHRFFSHRCEAALGELAEAHTELFFELLHLFGGQPPATPGADRSLVLLPLPNVPFLINFWQAEEDFPARLYVLFDRTASDNTTVESLYLLGRGLVEMFRLLIVKHNRDGKLF